MSSVLVVVDMQNGFVSTKSEPIVPKVVDLVERWEDSGRDVVFTRFINGPGSQFERLIHWSRLQDSPEIDIVPELASHAERAVAVVDKPAMYSSFTPEFTTLVEQHEWTDFVVCGIATESCVMKTATDAFERGHTPWLVTDASYSHAGEEPHLAGLLVIKRFIGRDQMVTSDALFQPGHAAA
ncbi:isochorismatase family cysteine hydrolase [Saccharopolyspora taberi]|uniref:Cysteine hydrolase n=1 Tax=Saccharopolyspora taberi TaxID=60895 RepID=A0ABN3VNE5_9PSEU